jgi:biotin-dependent carboxylase-like uncharacterized protein
MNQAHGARHLTVIRQGWATSIQDGGRPGWAHLGVSPSGAMDASSAALANRLVGNAVGAAVIESVGDLLVSVDHTTVMAVTGAQVEVQVDGRVDAVNTPIMVGASSIMEIAVAPVGRGRWCYVAVLGGVDASPALGSRSWDSLGSVGPAPPRTGDRLSIGPAPAHGVVVDLAPQPPWPEGDLMVRIWPGPRVDWFTSTAWSDLIGIRWTVGALSDRIGMRLEGGTVHHRPDRGELPSEGLVTGSVQVPPDGRPVVMMRDHPTTGGYPVIAVIDPADLDQLVQRQPGEGVRMVPVSTGPTTLGVGGVASAP